MVRRKKHMAQMESEDVERVRDFRIGERPRRMEEMRAADLIVERRSCVRLGGGIGATSGIVVVTVPVVRAPPVADRVPFTPFTPFAPFWACWLGFARGVAMERGRVVAGMAGGGRCVEDALLVDTILFPLLLPLPFALIGWVLLPLATSDVALGWPRWTEAEDSWSRSDTALRFSLVVVIPRPVGIALAS